MRKKMEGVRVSALNNLAACSLKERRYEDTIGFCEDVLRANSRDVKAMYRLGQVRGNPTGSGSLSYTKPLASGRFDLSNEPTRPPCFPIVVTVGGQDLVGVFILSTYREHVLAIYQALLGVSRLEEAVQKLTEALRLDPANQVGVASDETPGDTPRESMHP
jgi:tetratricopeptide (TPR) repeat protein